MSAAELPAVPGRDTLAGWVARWREVLPSRGTLPAAPRRIILHWTGGGPEANDVDRAHYHAIVGHSLRVVRGTHPVSANMRALHDGHAYAGHTGGFNSYSLGLSAAGMLDWTLARPGRYGLTAPQVDVLLTGAAWGCALYGLRASDPAHLFTHREAWTLHRVKGQQNDQKIDIAVLPFLPALGPDAVGPWLRARAAQMATALRFFLPPTTDAALRRAA